MKVQNIILLRRKYISYLFELADKHFPDRTQLNGSVEEFNELIQKNDELQVGIQRLNSLQTDVNDNLEPLENMTKFNAKSMKENSQIKQNLTKKIKQLNKDYEDNYREMNDLYQGIILHNASIMMNELRLDPMFKKMQDAISLTDNEFITFCNEFKQDEIAKSEDIKQRANQIVSYYNELLNTIVQYRAQDIELKENHLNMAIKMKLKNSKLKIIDLVQKLDSEHNEYKLFYSETLKFRVNEIKPISLIVQPHIEEMQEDKISEPGTDSMIVTDISNAHLQSDNLLQIETQVTKYLDFYSDALKNNDKLLKSLYEEKDKIIKAAIPYEELTIKAARQWLEIDKEGWFAKTREYISQHTLATNMTISLMD